MAARSRQPKTEENIDFRLQLRGLAEKQFGEDKIQDYDRFMDQIRGVPLFRNLPLQFLFGLDVIPLGRFLSIVGEWGSSKSSLGWYLGTLYARVGGMLIFIETERKSNPDQFKGLVSSYIDTSDMNWFCWNPAGSLDSMLQSDIWFINNLVQNGGYKLGRPFLIMDDSLAAPASEAEQEAVLKDGQAAGYSDARNAALIKKTFQSLVDPLAAVPATLAVINHQKIKVDPQGARGAPSYIPPKMNETGGGHQHFAYTYLFQLEKIGKKKTAAGTYPMIRISPKKTSMSDGYRHINVPYKSLWTGTEGEEYIWYDWDTSLVTLLMDESVIDKKSLSAVFDLKKAGAFYSSDRLGVKSLSVSQMGKAIHDDAELVKDLQDKVMHIRRKPTYGTVIPGIDKLGIGTGLSVEDEGDTVPEETE